MCKIKRYINFSTETLCAWKHFLCVSITFVARPSYMCMHVGVYAWITHVI